MIEVRKDQFTEARSESEKSLIDTSYSSYQKKKKKKTEQKQRLTVRYAMGIQAGWFPK